MMPAVYRSACLSLLVLISVVTPALAAEEEHQEIVQLTAAEVEEFQIVVATASSKTIATIVSVPAEIQPDADRLAHIVPRYSGIVTSVRVGLGDKVRKGQTLAIVEGDDSLANFEVRTLLSGTVIEKHITLGEAVGRQGPAFVIADLTKVYAELTVYQRDLAKIQTGQRVEVHIGHEYAGQGTISYITPIMHERTRTATARVVLDNQDGKWRPGMFITARVFVDTATVPVAVERSALHDFEGSTVVFVKTPEGFIPRPVRLGRADADSVEILEGLRAGEEYVSSGGFTLKAELGKESFGDGHGH